MRNKIKKLAAVVLAVAMAVGCFSTGFASDMDTSDIQIMSVAEDGTVYESAGDTAGMTETDGPDMQGSSAGAAQETGVSGAQAEDAGSVSTEKLGFNVKTENPVSDNGSAETPSDEAVSPPENESGDAADEEEAEEETAEEAAETEAVKEADGSYGLYGGYDGKDSMNDPDSAGSCVGWDLSTFSAISSASGLWWIDDYYVGESSDYDVTKTDDFSLKYQIEFHASEDLEAGAVKIVIDAALGAYRGGNNIIPNDIGIPYGTPGNYTESPSSPFNYYYIDKDGNILTADQAKTAEGVQIVVWNYRDIDSGSNAMFQILYKSLDVMQIPDMTNWSLDLTATVTTDNAGVESVKGNTLTGLVDTQVLLSSVTKKAYTAQDLSYTPELYTQTQVSSYITGSIPEPYASDFDDYIYLVWYITLKGSATQAYEITINEDTFCDVTGNGNIVGYKVYSSGTSQGVNSSYGIDSDSNPILTFSSSSQRSFSAAFYVVTAYDADTYESDTEIENDVDITAHPVDGHDEDVTKSASASTTWGEYEWNYSGDTIGIRKYADTTGIETNKTYSGYETLYELQKADGKDTGEFTFHTQSTDRGYAFTHNIDDTGVGEYIDGTYYTTTTVDDALYIYPNGGTTPSQMLTKDDYYFSSVKVVTTDNGYDVWEDKTAGAVASDTVDQDVYIYAMYYDQGNGADKDGWEYVGSVPFSASGTMTYTFSADDLAKQPYRVKAVHNTINYATYCTITLGVTLRGDSPTIAEILKEYGDDLTSLKIENLSGVAGQAYGQDARPGTVYVNGKEYHDGDYFQDTSIENGNYSEKDTVTGETLAEFTEDLYGTILMRNNAYATLTELTETADACKAVQTQNDTANARVLADYYITAYEGYNASSQTVVDLLKEADINLPARNDVEFYDLLPYGMKYNGSVKAVAGRITSMNSTGTWRTNTGAWNTSGVTVTVDDSDITDNWNGTGRELVRFHIHYDGDDAGEYYSAKQLWYEGYGIYFQAYYDWADMEAVDEEYNIAAYIVDNVTKESEQLLGAKDGEVWKDDGSVDLSAVGSQYDPFKISDLNGDGVTGWYTNMYASTITTTDFATASSDSIKKKVRADADVMAEYGSTAIVGNGLGYTYEISLTNTENTELSDIVLFDRLEYSVEDGRSTVETGSSSVFNGVDESDIENHWTGTFTGVTLTALYDLGIDPVVYYSADRDAVISSADGTTTPADVLTESNGWYTEERFIEVYGDLSYVTAVAVDISTDTNGDPFVLKAGESLSYQIHMVAPGDTDLRYAFNNPSYYSVSTDRLGDVTRATDIGDTVRVELGEAGTLEVEKEFTGGSFVPDSMKNAKFTFTLLRNGTAVANQEYMVYTWDEDAGEWISSGVISATDAKGQFTLRAGQKAVFSDIVNTDELTVEEAEETLWEIMKSDRAEDGNEVYYSFENTYRSPVYLYKTVKTTDLATEEELEGTEFTFRITVDDEPWANKTVLYVDEAVTDGSSPNVIGYGTTDGNGEITLHIGDIIAFFPMDADGNNIDVSYEITEVASGESWFCGSDTVSGTTGDYGKTATVTNYYKYRALIITKSLASYDKDVEDCEDPWTLKVTDANGNPVTGNAWYMIDADGNPVYVLDENGSPTDEIVGGTLDENGEFTFTGAGSGRRVVITGLVEGEKYTVTETGYDTELYETVNDGTYSATMPTYSITKSGTITNRYLPRDLSVSKIALSSNADADVSGHEFTFTLKDADGNVIAGAEYTIEGGDGTVYATDGNGQFTLKGGQTAVFDDIGNAGDTFIVSETADDDYPQIYPSDGADGSAELTNDGGEIRFINGDFEEVAFLTKELNGLDETGEAYADLVRGDNTAATLTDGEDDYAYSVDVTFGVYDGDSPVTGDAGALVDYTNNNSSYPFVYIRINSDGSYVLKSYNGGEIMESLAPYDYIYIAQLGNYTLKASENAEMERVILDTAWETGTAIGSDEILSEGSVMSGSAAADESIVFVNDISSCQTRPMEYPLGASSRSAWSVTTPRPIHGRPRPA